MTYQIMPYIADPEERKKAGRVKLLLANRHLNRSQNNYLNITTFTKKAVMIRYFMYAVFDLLNEDYQPHIVAIMEKVKERREEYNKRLIWRVRTYGFSNSVNQEIENRLMRMMDKTLFVLDYYNAYPFLLGTLLTEKTKKLKRGKKIQFYLTEDGKQLKRFVDKNFVF
jgi:hypothetical protein